MTKQLKLHAENLSPIFKASIGFDRLFDEMEARFANGVTQGYPPYNISKDADDVYEITLAVAGFKKDDIEIDLEDGTLKVSGKSSVLEQEGREFLHKGIAERNFQRTFKLAEYVEVEDAQLQDGILRISLFRNVPEAMKPKKITIS